MLEPHCERANRLLRGGGILRRPLQQQGWAKKVLLDKLLSEPTLELSCLRCFSEIVNPALFSNIGEQPTPGQGRR